MTINPLIISDNLEIRKNIELIYFILSFFNNNKKEFFSVRLSSDEIEFYSWDFTYKKEGKQIMVLKVGKHSIDVKVFGNEGLENT